MTTTMQNNTGIEPVGRHLLLDVTPKEHTSAAGIVLPTSVQGASTRMEGVVVASGPYCALGFQPGVTVYVTKYMSSEIERSGNKYKLANEDDVIAILEQVSASMPDTVSDRDPIEPN